MTDFLLDIPAFLRRADEPAAAPRRPRPQAWRMPKRRPPMRKRPGQIKALHELGYSSGQITRLSRRDADQIVTLNTPPGRWFED